MLSNYPTKVMTARPQPVQPARWVGWVRVRTGGQGGLWRSVCQGDSHDECLKQLVAYHGRNLDRLVLRGDEDPRDPPKGMRRGPGR